MPKKSNTKNSKKDDSDDDFDVDEDPIENDLEEDNLDEEDEDEDNGDEEGEDKIKKEDNPLLDQDVEGTGCTIDEAIQDDDEYFDNNEETEIPIEKNLEYVNKENRVSSNRLTKYEMVRILGERTKQLTMGAKPMIKNFEGLNYEKIAEEEFKRNMIPFKIKRPLPNGKFEIWTLDELMKEHLLSLLE